VKDYTKSDELIEKEINCLEKCYLKAIEVNDLLVSEMFNNSKKYVKSKDNTD
jgi:hypothetical protein